MYCSSCGANVADGTAFCGSCGRPIIGYSVGGPGTGPSGVPASSGVMVAGATIAPPYTGTTAITSGSYAGFWLRVAASFIDGLVLAIPTVIVIFAAFASVIPALAQVGRPANSMLIVGVFLPRMLSIMALLILGSWLYCSLMESSSWQATVGKRVLGLYVTDLAGHRASFGRTSGRFFAGRGIGSLVGIYYLVDCLLVAFTEKKQALHDIIAATLVMKRS